MIPSKPLHQLYLQRVSHQSMRITCMNLLHHYIPISPPFQGHIKMSPVWPPCQTAVCKDQAIACQDTTAWDPLTILLDSMERAIRRLKLIMVSRKLVFHVEIDQNRCLEIQESIGCEYYLTPCLLFHRSNGFLSWGNRYWPKTFKIQCWVCWQHTNDLILKTERKRSFPPPHNLIYQFLKVLANYRTEPKSQLKPSVSLF